MITSRESYIRIDRPEHIKLLSEVHIELLQRDDKYQQIRFRVPDAIIDFRDKDIYKVGFLMHLLKTIYPDKKFGVLHDILVSRYDVHFARRTIERYYTEFRKIYNLD